MPLIRLILTVIGLIAALIGLVWIGQGTGVFPYPASSFMINQSPWTTRGVIVTIAGVALVWLARRFLKPR